MIVTIQSNGLNTLGRAVRHHQYPGPPVCEHGCMEEDRPNHRLLDCEGTEALRRDLVLTRGECEYLRALHRCHSELAFWLQPGECQPYVLQANAAWGLWPTQQWIEQLMNFHFSVESQPVVQLDIQEVNLGNHPQLHRRRADVCFPGLGWPMLTARALADAQSNRVWIADTLILAALIRIFSQRRVQVFARVPEDEITKAWASIQDGQSANAYLSHMIMAARSDVYLVSGPMIPLPVREDLLLQPPLASRQVWDYHAQLSRKVCAFWDASPDFYPEAARVSHSHGQIRGGFWRPIEESGDTCGDFGCTAVWSGVWGFCMLLIDSDSSVCTQRNDGIVPCQSLQDESSHPLLGSGWGPLFSCFFEHACSLESV